MIDNTRDLTYYFIGKWGTTEGQTYTNTIYDIAVRRRQMRDYEERPFAQDNDRPKVAAVFYGLENL